MSVCLNTPSMTKSKPVQKSTDPVISSDYYEYIIIFDIILVYYSKMQNPKA